MRKFYKKMNNNSFQDIYKKLKSSENILISLHSSPDGDSIGSCASMKYFLETKLNKKVRLISYDNLSKNLMCFGNKYGVEFGVDITEVDLSQFDLILVLDTSAPERIGNMKKEYTLSNNLYSISIDHHQYEKKFTDLVYCDENAVSTCSILLNFFNELNINIDKELAERLLLGICTDSVFLTIYKADKAIKEVNYLIQKGASYFDILKKIKFNTPLALKKYFNLQIDNFILNKEKKFGYSIIKFDEIKDLDLNISDIRLGVQVLTDIEGLDFVFNLIETPEGIKGSFRGKNGMNILPIVNAIGGSGHKDCAGFYLKNISLKETEKKILRAIDNYFENKKLNNE